MKDKDITAKDLGKLSNVSYRTIENYMSANSSKPVADKAVKIAMSLNTTVEYLVTGIEPMGLVPPRLERLVSLAAQLPEHRIRDLERFSQAWISESAEVNQNAG